MSTIAAHYNALASERDHYLDRHHYYYSQLYKQYQYFISKGKRVLEVGCATGELLHAVAPAVGVGIDISPEMTKVAQKKFPQYRFHAGTLEQVRSEEKFDYIILSGLLGEVEDIQQFLEKLRAFCTNDTRIVIEYYSVLWQYLLKIGERFKFKIPQQLQNWLTANDIKNFLNLAGYDCIKSDKAVLFPLWLPGVSYVLNRYVAKLPFFNALTLNHFIIARPLLSENPELSVSVLVPCRNERDNVEPAVVRLPKFGKHQEIIFVEGNSDDGTADEIKRVIAKYPEKDIKLYQEEKGKKGGKGNAVRLGFAKAQGEVLMILDADLTTPPEDMPKFYKALRSNKGEFINGCRLIYPMEKEAMRFLNLLGNKFFSLFFSWLLGQTFKDTLCGTKVMTKKNYDELVANRHYFGDFDPFGDFDLIFGAVKLNLKVIELPIRYRDRTYGTTKIKRFQHGLLLLRMCLFAMKKIKFI